MNDEGWLIVDTETDGVLTPIHAVEIAAQRMRGWQRDGAPFRVLLNHDVPIDPRAQAVHGYSRDYLRAYGVRPREAHAAFRDFTGDLPMVAYNLSFDWDRVLRPEYARLGLPDAGRRGFCALTLARRVVRDTVNHRLDTLKTHFSLNLGGRSHQGHEDVETVTSLFERVLAPAMNRAGISGFAAVADFSRRTPVRSCLDYIHGNSEASVAFRQKPARPARRIRWMGYGVPAGTGSTGPAGTNRAIMSGPLNTR